jgi:hypothetical protein
MQPFLVKPAGPWLERQQPATHQRWLTPFYRRAIIDRLFHLPLLPNAATRYPPCRSPTQVGMLDLS